MGSAGDRRIERGRARAPEEVSLRCAKVGVVRAVCVDLVRELVVCDLTSPAVVEAV